MSNNIQDVLAQLRANKARRQNYEGASRRLFGTTVHKAKHQSDNLGKKIGFCPNCNLVQGEKNLDTDCRRCGDHISKDTVKKHSDPTSYKIWVRNDPWGNPTVRASCPIYGFPYLEER